MISRKKNVLIILLLIFAAPRLIIEAKAHSTDLHVYWRAAHLWLTGISPYVYDSSDGGNVYKYPPFTIPFFFPLGLISYDFTKWLWVILEIASIGYCIKWVVHAGASSASALIVAALFWWTWLGHVFAGQFSIFMMLAALWAVPSDSKKVSSWRASLLAVVFSAKVYSVFTLLGLWKTYLKPRTIFTCFGLVLFLEAIVFAVLKIHGNSISILELHQTWIAAAKSGAAELHGDVIRGNGNHSFTAALLRWFNVDALDSNRDAEVALGLGAAFSALWFHYSKKLTFADQWVGWIGVGMIIHPLLWHHSLVMAYPLCALAVDRANRSKMIGFRALSWISVFLVAILIPNIFGPDFVRPFEYLGSKSWGILLGGVVLVLTEKNRRRKNPEEPHFAAQP